MRPHLASQPPPEPCSTPLALLHHAGPSAPQRTGPTIAHQPPPTTYGAPPRLQEHPRNRRPQARQHFAGDFARSSTQVSRSAVKLLRHRCFPYRADHLPGLAARRRARPWSPDTGAPLQQPLPQAPPRPAAEFRRRRRCVTPQPFPSLVSIPSASPFCCARRLRVWRTRGAPATLAGAVPPPPSRPCRR